MLSDAHMRRSHLFVPANRPQYLAKAKRSKADAIIIDLEDSVALSDLPRAREAVYGAVRYLRATHYVSVRVNKPFDLLVDDLDVAVKSAPDGLMLPMVESGTEVEVVSALVEEREIRSGLQRGHIQFQLLVESCRGIGRAYEIAASSDRVVSMTLGVEDLATELEVEPDVDAFDVRWAHGLILMAARAAGIAPYGLLGSLSNFGDLEKLTRDVADSRGFGYLGAFCIHPSQIPVVNAGFAPSRREIARATRIVEAMNSAAQRGDASVAVEGRMVDTPVLRRAESILRRTRETGATEPV